MPSTPSRVYTPSRVQARLPSPAREPSRWSRAERTRQAEQEATRLRTRDVSSARLFRRLQTPTLTAARPHARKGDGAWPSMIDGYVTSDDGHTVISTSHIAHEPAPKQLPHPWHGSWASVAPQREDWALPSSPTLSTLRASGTPPRTASLERAMQRPA